MSTIIRLNTPRKSTSWFLCWPILCTYSACTVCCTADATGCSQTSKPSYQILRCVLYIYLPQNAALKCRFPAGLSGNFRSFFDGAQNSHRSFGSGRVSASRFAQDTRLVLPRKLLMPTLIYGPGTSQKEWLTDAVDLMARLGVILQALDNAVNLLNDTGRMSPRENHETRQTYLLMSSCKLFCMTARARIYKATADLPIVPKDQKNYFCGLARESIQSFFIIYRSFNQEGDIRHLDYFTVVSQNGNPSEVLDVTDGRRSLVGIISASSTLSFTQATSSGTRSRRSLGRSSC